jgi:hypothetical protein
MRNVIDDLRSWWDGFKYKFGWPNYVLLFDGWVARCAMTIPIIGYLIVFNDAIAQHISFDKLASESTSAFGLSASARLKLVYLGLLFVGLASLLYRWKRPWVMRLANNQIDYVDKALKHFSVGDYITCHGRIRHSDRDPYTIDGKYYDSEWEDFLEAATGSRPGASLREASTRSGHWNEAKSKFEGLLRSMLNETFFCEAFHTRRGWLIFCLALAAIGYPLLAIPSLDLLMKVLTLIIKPLVA